MLTVMTGRFTVILFAIVGLVTACTGSQVEPSPTAVVTSPVEPSPTVSVPVQVEPSPTAGATSNRTGLADLDNIIAVALGGDTAELQQLLGFTSTNCTFAEGLGGPPRCLETEKEGDPVEVIPFLGPEGSFLRKEDMGSWQGLEVSELFAVYQVSESAYSDTNYPKGEYAIVLIGNQEQKTSITLQVKNGKIIRIDYGFGYPPEIRPGEVVRYLVPPANTNP